MKSTGIVRNVDNSGRFVLPSELREIFGLKNGGGLVEVYVEGDSIVLKKYEPKCVFCGSHDNIKEYMDKNVCSKCASKMSNL